MPAEHESDDAVNSPLSEGAASFLGADDDVVVDRPDDDDYDLLTFGEAGARLAEEIIKLERRIAAALANGAAEHDVATARSRLDLLRQTAERNRKPSLDELRASGFFGKHT